MAQSKAIYKYSLVKCKTVHMYKLVIKHSFT